MTVALLDSPVAFETSQPTAFVVSAGSNRRAFVVCMMSSGTYAPGFTSITLGGQSMTLVVGQEALTCDSSAQIWELREAGIAAMSGSALSFSANSSAFQSFQLFSIQDANQSTETTASDIGYDDNGDQESSGNISLVRATDSFTFAAISFDNKFNTSSLTNPTDTWDALDPTIDFSAAFGYQTDSSGTSNVGWICTGSPARDFAVIAVNVGSGAAVATVTQTDATPEDNVLQTINSTGLTGNYTAATLGGVNILGLLNNVVSTTASTYTLNNFVTVEGPVSRISEAVDLAVAATGGTPTQSITISPETGKAVVTLTSVDRTTGAPDSNMILEIEATGETVAIGDQFYYETADNTVITAAGVPTSDALNFDLVLIQGSVTSANGVPFTIETASVTAPTLSLPTSASITKTGATIGCTTNESGGTMYFYISTSATETSVTIIASGESQTVSGVGIQTRALTGLTQGTNYYGHMVQVDSDTEESNVIVTTQFATVSDDITPDQFSLGADVTNAELSVNTKRSFISAGIDVSITWTATGAGLVSLTENGVYGATVDAGNATEIWFELDASASYATLVTGGVAADGVSDSINVTTRAEVAPVLAATKSYNRRINQTSTGVIVPTGGDTPTSYSNPAGADGAQYTINSSGVWERTVNNPTVEAEVFTTTATNAAGTSAPITVTVNYTSSGIPATKFRRFPWQGYNPL